MTWDEFYELDLTDKEDRTMALLKRLTSFGDPDEVVEVAQFWLSDDDKRSVFVNKAMDAKVSFDFEQTKELLESVNRDTANRLIRAYRQKLTKAQLEDIEDLADPEVFDEVCGAEKWYIRKRINEEGLNVHERDVKHVKDVYQAEAKQEKQMDAAIGFSLLAFLLGHKSQKASKAGEKCLYFNGSFCSVSSFESAISEKCTNGQYMNCYYFQTRKSRKKN